MAPALEVECPTMNAKDLLKTLVGQLSTPAAPAKSVKFRTWLQDRPSMAAWKPEDVAEVTLSLYYNIAASHKDKVPFDVIDQNQLRKLTAIINELSNGCADLHHFITSPGHLHDKVRDAILSVLTNHYFAGPDIPFTALLGKRTGELGAFQTIVIPTYLSMIKGGTQVNSTRLPHRNIDDVLSELAPKPAVEVTGLASKLMQDWLVMDKTPMIPTIKPLRVWYKSEAVEPLAIPCGMLKALPTISSPFLNLCWCAASERETIWPLVPQEVQRMFAEFHPGVVRGA